MSVLRLSAGAPGVRGSRAPRPHSRASKRAARAHNAHRCDRSQPPLARSLAPAQLKWGFDIARRKTIPRSHRVQPRLRDDARFAVARRAAPALARALPRPASRWCTNRAAPQQAARQRGRAGGAAGVAAGAAAAALGSPLPARQQAHLTRAHHRRPLLPQPQADPALASKISAKLPASADAQLAASNLQLLRGAFPREAVLKLVQGQPVLLASSLSEWVEFFQGYGVRSAGGEAAAGRGLLRARRLAGGARHACRASPFTASHSPAAGSLMLRHHRPPIQKQAPREPRSRPHPRRASSAGALRAQVSSQDLWRLLRYSSPAFLGGSTYEAGQMILFLKSQGFTDQEVISRWGRTVHWRSGAQLGAAGSRPAGRFLRPARPSALRPGSGSRGPRAAARPPPARTHAPLHHRPPRATRPPGP